MILFRLLDDFRHVNEFFPMVSLLRLSVSSVAVVRFRNRICIIVFIGVSCNESPFASLLCEGHISSAVRTDIECFKIIVVDYAISNPCCILTPVILKALSAEIFFKSRI